MRIGIYSELACDPKPTGIGLHVRELLHSLAKIDRANEYLLYYPSSVQTGATAFPELTLPANFRPRPVWFPKGWHANRPRVWWKWYLPRILRRDRLDVFHGPNHFVTPRIRGMKSVVTIHDLAYFRMEIYGGGMDQLLRDWTLKAVEWSDAVIALSENTRKDIEGLHVPPERIHVIYGGGHVVPDDKIRFDRADELRRQFHLPEKYVLFVGTLQPRKNVPFLVRAFAQLKKSGNFPHKLVLAGHRDTATEEIETLARNLGVADDLIITGYVESWQLPLLYKLADVFVLPTLYEGFTLVTLEAMAYGTPCIATDTSSIREGVGDAATLVPVNDDAALAESMRTVLVDAERRADLIRRGQQQAKKFTWDRCAERTLELYQSLVSNVGEQSAAGRAHAHAEPAMQAGR